MVMRRMLVLTFLALLVTTPAAEAAKRRVPHGFYGAMWDGQGTAATQARQEREWRRMGRAGVESVRTVFSWAAAQPVEGGPTNFATTDRIVARAARTRRRLLPVVLDTPAWARLYEQERDSPPASADPYTSYITELIRRYGPRGRFWREHPELPRRPVREWQIWNEPHLDSFWFTPGDDWATGYVGLLQASYRAVKAADRGARVVAGALGNFAWENLQALYDAGGKGFFDVAAINFFTARPHNVLLALRLFRGVLDSAGERRKPIWLTEVSWPAAKGRFPPPLDWMHEWVTTDRGMARRLRAAYLLLVRSRRLVGLARVYWYTWGSSYQPGNVFHYGGLVRFDGRRFHPKPAMRTYCALARRHQGRAGCR
jgi:hypothetical protein